jgi:hypothetical protein
MKCDKCGSERVIGVSGKCSDLFHAVFKKEEISDYVPRDMGIGGGDYIEFSYCLECGKIQGKFPLDDPLWFTALEEEGVEE